MWRGCSSSTSEGGGGDYPTRSKIEGELDLGKFEARRRVPDLSFGLPARRDNDDGNDDQDQDQIKIEITSTSTVK